MSKAITGAAMLAGAGVIFGLALLAPEVLWPIAAIAMHTMVGLAAAGVSMEAGALADALTSNRGQQITTRTPAGLRQIIYGPQRVAGTVVYQSTTGVGGSSGNYVYNYVIPIAGHQLDAYINVYLDGRRVYWKQDGNVANVGCGSVSTPPACIVTMSGAAVAGVSATGGSGFARVKPTRFRVRFYGGAGSGAAAYATLSGSTWTVTVTHGGSYTIAPSAEIQGAYTFGGIAAADEQDSFEPGYGLGYGIAPDGSHYNFSGKVFCEARFGDQPAGDYMASLSANDSSWPSTALGGGVAYIYLNVGYDQNLFPSPPEVRVTVNGKNDIYDPRTGTIGFTTNWALQVADVLADPTWGVGDGPVSSWPSNALNQLIAAANVCDEQIYTAQGYESRYAQAIHYDTSTAPGDALALMMPSAAGRISHVGGGWLIFPAYWQGPSFSFDESALIDTISWTPNRSFKDLFNRVNGTYIAPNTPYNIAGNLYDSNGWYYGSRANTWPLSWQPTNFPQYAADVLHGYAADEYLIEDGGVVLPKELTLRGVISIAQAQRIAKITLLRNRFQGTGVFPMQLAAWQMQPVDVMQFSFSQLGWASKYLEVDGEPAMQFVCEEDKAAEGDDQKAMRISVVASVRETDPSIYEWSSAEELTPYDVPAFPAQLSPTPAPPTSLTVTSSAATAIVAADGNVTPRALLRWTAPLDNTVTQIQMQYQKVGDAVWQDAGSLDVALFEGFISPLVAGSTYNFRIRSLRARGTFSDWVTALNETISITFSISVTSGVDVAPPGTLMAVAVSGGTANIIVFPFTATIGSLTASCLPGGDYTITGCACNELYFVYYIDPTFAGGNITPIATQNAADFLNKLGYFLIGEVTTPNAASVVYRPTGFVASGSQNIVNPENAYDSNPTTCAAIPALGTGTAGSPPDTAYGGTCEYYLFPSITTVAVKTLTITAAVNANTANCGATIAVSLDGGSTWTTPLSTSATTAKANYTVSVPSGTNLSSIQVIVQATGTTAATMSPSTLQILVYDINIA